MADEERKEELEEKLVEQRRERNEKAKSSSKSMINISTDFVVIALTVALLGFSYMNSSLPYSTNVGLFLIIVGLALQGVFTYASIKSLRSYHRTLRNDIEIDDRRIKGLLEELIDLSEGEDKQKYENALEDLEDITEQELQKFD